MNQETRACVAYIAGRLITGLEVCNIYDASQAKYLVLSGSLGAREIVIHDAARDCWLSGTGRSGTYRLYDQGAAHHLSLIIEGEKFEGYDYGSICHFRGRVDGHSIALYDYGERRRFSYRL